VTEVIHDIFSNLKGLDDRGTFGLVTGGDKVFSIPQKSPDQLWGSFLGAWAVGT